MAGDRTPDRAVKVYSTLLTEPKQLLRPKFPATPMYHHLSWLAVDQFLSFKSWAITAGHRDSHKFKSYSTTASHTAGSFRNVSPVSGERSKTTSHLIFSHNLEISQFLTLILILVTPVFITGVQHIHSWLHGECWHLCSITHCSIAKSFNFCNLCRWIWIWLTILGWDQRLCKRFHPAVNVCWCGEAVHL